MLEHSVSLSSCNISGNLYFYLLFLNKKNDWPKKLYKLSWRKYILLQKCNVLLHSRNWKVQYVFTKCYTTHKISIIKSSEHGNPFSTRFTLPCLRIRNFRKHMHFQLFPSIDSWFFRRYVNGLTTVHQETINDAINAINWYFTMCLFRR